MSCLLSCHIDPPADLHFISRIANEDSCKYITGEERVFILKEDKVLEYSQKTGAITETDLRITKPDYEAIVKQIIDEKIFNEGFIPDKEYVLDMIRFLLDSDLIKFDFDISGIKIKPVMDFLVRLDDKEIIIRELIGKEDEDEDEDLDKATIYTCEIKKFLKSGCDSKKIIYLKTIVLITHLIMQKFDELGLDY